MDKRYQLNHKREFAFQRQNQNKGYKSGKALENHLQVCHNGIFDENCNACKELRLKCSLT